MLRILDQLLSKKLAKMRKPHGFDMPVWCGFFLNEVENIQMEWKQYKEKIGEGVFIDELSKDQELLNEDKKWKALFLYGYSFLNEKELMHFPETAKLIQNNLDEITLVMLSTTESGKHIPAHTGNNHGVLRLQIGIDITEPEKCSLRVEDKTVQLKEKEIFIFDDTFEHELVNNSNSNRTVLIIDYYKPLPFLYRVLNKRKIAEIAKSDYVQSVIKKITK